MPAQLPRAICELPSGEMARVCQGQNRDLWDRDGDSRPTFEGLPQDTQDEPGLSPFKAPQAMHDPVVLFNQCRVVEFVSVGNDCKQFIEVMPFM